MRRVVLRLVRGFVRRDSRELDRSAQVSGYEVFTRTQKTGIDEETGCLIVAAREADPPASYRWANSRSASLPLLVPRCHERLNCRT